MPTECSVTIRLSLLLKLAYLSQKARAHRPGTDIMGFLEGTVHSGKGKELSLELTGCHPVFESEFMEKAFPDEVFRKGKELGASRKKGEPAIVGWYHTHSKRSVAMSVMDRINHLSLLEVMVADGGLQGTLEEIYQGEEPGKKGKERDGQEQSIIAEEGVALIYCPALQKKGKELKDYLRVYAFADSGEEKDVPISDFSELAACHIDNDLDGCLETMAELGTLAASQPAVTDVEEEEEPPVRKKSAKPRKKTASPVAATARAGKKKTAARKKQGRKKPLDRAGLERYLKKELQVKKRLARIQAMIEGKKDIGQITNKLKETRLYLDKLSSSLEKEQPLLQSAKDPETLAVKLEFEELVRRLRKESTELEKIIAEMYYKVLGDLSDEGALPPQE